MLAIYLAAAGFGAVLVLVSLVAGVAGHGGGSSGDLAKPDGLPDAPDVGDDLAIPGDTDVHLPDKPDIHLPDKPDVQLPDKPDLHAPDKFEVTAIFSFIPITSIRFWTYGFLAFGLVGASLELAAIPGWLSVSAASGTGVGLGWLAAQIFRRVLRDRVTGETDLSALIGREGVVVIAVRPGSRGKVAVEGPGGRVELPATTGDTHVLERGARVLITHVADGTAQITGLEPLRS